MFDSPHQHVWEIVRTSWPYHLGWGIACIECKIVLIQGLPKAEVEAAIARLTGKVLHG